MGKGGGDTSAVSIPKVFRPAFTSLFNSAFGAARTSAGQPGFGTLPPPGSATGLSNAITGGGGYGGYGPLGGPFQNPYQSAFPQPNPNIFSGPQNVPQQPAGGGQKGLPEQMGNQLQGQQTPAPQGGGQKGLPEQMGNQLQGQGAQPQAQTAPQPQPQLQDQAAPPPGTIPGDPGLIGSNNTTPGAAADAPFFSSPSSPPPPPGSAPTPSAGVKGDPFGPNAGDENTPAATVPGSSKTNPEGYYPTASEYGGVGIGSRSIPLTAGPPIIGQPFGEQFTAGTSPLEYESLAQREAQARQLQGIGNPLLNLGNYTAQGGFLSPESNPFLTSNIEASLRPITQEFTNSVLPNFQSNAIQSGAFSGSSARDMAFNQLASGYGQQVLDTGTGIAFDNYQRERQLQQQAGQLLDQGALLNQLTPEMLAQVGLGQRELAQRPLDEALLQHRESVNAPFGPLFPLASIIQGGDIGSAFSSNVPQPSALSSGLIGALGGASAGANIYDQLGGGGSGGLAALLGGLAGGAGGALI